MGQSSRRLHPGDKVAVFTSLRGRFRRNLSGTVMVISIRLGRGERLTVLLDSPTQDGFAVIDVLTTEVVRIATATAE